MTGTRATQRRQTRDRIVQAAIDAFAAHGFDGAGTRDIAARAGVTQGLVTYHFDSKQALWRAAADHLFDELTESLPDVDDAGLDEARARAAIVAYVTRSAQRPELFHFMVDAGRGDDDRMRWLVDTHLRPWHARIARLAPTTEAAPHLHYALVGAASLFFALAPEARALTGTDPDDPDVVARHAEFVADLFLR